MSPIRVRTSTLLLLFAPLMTASIVALSSASFAQADQPPTAEGVKRANTQTDPQHSQSPNGGSLVICGGGALPKRIMARFVELAGGKDAKLVVIPTASSRKIDVAAVKAAWNQRGAGSATVLHTRDRAEANTAEFVRPLKDATAVWFGGGQQSRLADAYLGTATEKEIMKLFQRGGVIGGSSAGAAFQSRVMIQSGNPTPTITKGLNLLPGAIIDQHFLQRNRFNRLLTAVRRNPARVGIGIDESTAIIFHNGKCQVAGESFVTVVRPPQGDAPLSIQTYRDGQAFVLSP